MSNQHQDLAVASHPDEVPAILDRAADEMRVAAMELSSAWQDKNAGQIWDIAADELNRAAMTIRKRLGMKNPD